MGHRMVQLRKHKPTPISLFFFISKQVSKWQLKKTTKGLSQDFWTKVSILSQDSLTKKNLLLFSKGKMWIGMNKSAAKLVIILLLCLAVVPPLSGMASADDLWSQKASMHVARSGLGAAAVNGYLYAIGGADAQKMLGTNERYDPAADTWTVQAAMPTPRNLFAIAVFQFKIYCIGGATDNGGVTAINEVYDPTTNTWETKAPMPTPRFELQASVVNGKIYCIGGTVANGSMTNINEVYDPITDTWSSDSSIPTATTIYASAVFSNKIYFIGGGDEPLNKLNQIFDPQTHNWSMGAPAPQGGYETGAVVTGVMATPRIYIFNNDGFNQIYNPKKNTWLIGAPVPTKNLIKFSSTTINDSIYLVGGAIWNYPYPLSDYIEEIPSTATLQYTPIGYGTPDPTYLEMAKPAVSIQSPINKTYDISSVPLVFTVNELSNWIVYSLDGQANTTFSDNTTLTNLPNGLHSLVIYAQDSFGNVGISEVTFEVSVPSFLALSVVTVSIALIGAAIIVIVQHSRKTN